MREKKALIKYLYTDFEQSRFFRVYQTSFTVSVQKKLNRIFEKDQHSWGKIYLLVRRLTKDQWSEKDVAIGFYVEVLNLCFSLYDDLMDGDKNSTLDKKAYYQLTRLLLESLELLSTFVPGEAVNSLIQKLNTAIDGEWIDVESQLTNESSEQDYFAEMLTKTTSVYQYIFSLASEQDPIFCEKVANKLGISRQLINDTLDCVNSEKSDLRAMKPTLPLIMANKHSQANGGLLFEQLNAYSASGGMDIGLEKQLHLSIRKSGALQYCLIVAYKAHQEAYGLVKDRFHKDKAKETEKLFRYLDWRKKDEEQN
ncbi:polyprenyl synthetase family protein [Enterococcus sp. BWB1-3]|uniref:polyprenyl synthetase family protein n=1 Tax=unclassified Enterococcus TaxID=2608891 RepID=UPI0019231F86|nr:MULTISPECIES: polyprenyl synthetase family protein [unclassified Enterococcus]MBL1227827.1 polyprenyl synthetase family protein [Enterococcus sp. BWB1-3]MCB5953318.1 polyprenyl synthetase family protein [Enterococcus sp. BWT-B8]